MLLSEKEIHKGWFAIFYPYLEGESIHIKYEDMLIYWIPCSQGVLPHQHHGCLHHLQCELHDLLPADA